MNGSFNTEGVQVVWDSTSIGLAQTCLRKYQYKLIEGWSSPNLSVHLRFGAHYATALEHYYKHVALGMTEEDALVEVVREALEDTWDRPDCETCGGMGQLLIHPEGVPFSQSLADMETCEICAGCGKQGVGTGEAWNSMHNLKTRETLIRSIVWYFDHFKDDPAPVHILADGKPAVEHSFAIPVDNGITFTGHIDRLVDYAGHPYVMDQKTSGSTIGPYFFHQFNPNVQMSMYTFAGQVSLGVPVKGVIIDAAQIAVGFTRFERNFTMRTEDQLEEWYDTSMYWIEQAQKAARENFFPMNTSSCGNYGGCEFRDICAKSPSVRKQFLEGNFVRNDPWDPSARR